MNSTKNKQFNMNKFNAKNQSSTNKKKYLVYIAGIVVLIILVIVIYNGYKYATNKTKHSTVIVSSPINAYTCRPGVKVDTSTEGMTQSISTWCYIDDWNYQYSYYKNIVFKGNPPVDSNNVPTSSDISTTTRNSPSIFLYPFTSNLKFITSTLAPEGIESVDIANVPLKSWFHIVYVLNNRTVDIYLNGKLERSQTLKGVPILDDSDQFYVTTGNPQCGYYGKLGSTIYYTNALSPSEVSSLYSYGPHGNASYNIKFFQDGKFLKISNDSGYND